MLCLLLDSEPRATLTRRDSFEERCRQQLLEPPSRSDIGINLIYSPLRVPYDNFTGDEELYILTSPTGRRDNPDTVCSLQRREKCGSVAVRCSMPRISAAPWWSWQRHLEGAGEPLGQFGWGVVLFPAEGGFRHFRAKFVVSPCRSAVYFVAMQPERLQGSPVYLLRFKFPLSLCPVGQ
ncbi:hypothetical protein NDU88_000161 [Pleurodeles waltl]|uniref:Uncharacterized protein n=1 Tax=Pleurodeles waltl TaxID=8319 RepID=A0AAV7UPZ6_PLEWA|nr:hypothetical protein NDU88_000161 [Pleurodeles waltl]